MNFIAVILSAFVILAILWDSFETTVLPRRVTHRYRFARFFYQSTWAVWRLLAMRLPAGKRRESFLSLFGPLSLLALLGTWVLGLIFAFALLYWSLGIELHAAGEEASFGADAYMSGVTFFTLGFGDVTPTTATGRILVTAEAGIGFGFLALIISYLPVTYQVFSRREVLIGVLDARAGSPPSAAELLLRSARSGNMAALDPFLAECERWSAELLESHLSFPVLALYRSQHDNQSWLAALTAILDTCALLLTAVKEHNVYQAQLTFAIARHAVVDLALVFKAPPIAPQPDRLTAATSARLRQALRETGLTINDGAECDARLATIRGMYEPFVNALAQRFLLALPPFAPEAPAVDNWQRSAWMKRAPGIGRLTEQAANNDHFD